MRLGMQIAFGRVRRKTVKKYAEIPKQYEKIRRNTLSIHRNTQAKTPQAKTLPGLRTEMAHALRLLL